MMYVRSLERIASATSSRTYACAHQYRTCEPWNGHSQPWTSTEVPMMIASCMGHTTTRWSYGPNRLSASPRICVNLTHFYTGKHELLVGSGQLRRYGIETRCDLDDHNRTVVTCDVCLKDVDTQQWHCGDHIITSVEAKRFEGGIFSTEVLKKTSFLLLYLNISANPKVSPLKPYPIGRNKYRMRGKPRFLKHI